MGNFFREHVLWLDFLNGGFAISMSWGFFFGIPATILGLRMFNAVSNWYHKWKRADQESLSAK